jgi:hypothetical protein
MLSNTYKKTNQLYKLTKQTSSILKNAGCFVLNNFGFSKKDYPACNLSAPSNKPSNS